MANVDNMKSGSLNELLTNDKFNQAMVDNDLYLLKEVIAQYENGISAATPLPPRVDMFSLKILPPTDRQCLLNNWALERGGRMSIVAPTGFGKSVLSVQMAFHFAIGKATCGMVPNGEFKVLYIQNEDSDFDMATQTAGASAELTEDEKKLVASNVYTYSTKGVQGDAFLKVFGKLCEANNFDIVIINPIQKYFGGDPNNSKEVNDFLNKLDAVVSRHDFGLIYINHTIKQSDNARKNSADTSYANFGSAAWGNDCREVLELKHKKDGIYFTLNAGKRKRRWQWGTDKILIKQNGNCDKPFWIVCETDELNIIEMLSVDPNDPQDQYNAKVEERIRRIVAGLPMYPNGISRETCRKAIKMGKKPFDVTFNYLLDEGKIKKLPSSKKVGGVVLYCLPTEGMEVDPGAAEALLGKETD